VAATVAGTAPPLVSLTDPDAASGLTVHVVSYRAAVLVGALVTVVSVSGCSSSSSDSTGPTRATYSFDCCAGGSRSYHPGEVVTLRWIPREDTSDAAAATPIPITLTAVLDGGYSSAAAAKSGHSGGAVHVEAPAVNVTDATGKAPVSRLRIPADAAPGLYNLTTGMQWNHSQSESSTGIIRVVRR